jgi:hypothetical protein
LARGHGLVMAVRLTIAKPIGDVYEGALRSHSGFLTTLFAIGYPACCRLSILG